MEGDTAGLRSAAASWSLAGDAQLLGILQNLHQSIISKSQEASSQLESMVEALDSANIDLQNVNNKFLALSNSQFVESRVYDDHTDITEITNRRESPRRAPPSPGTSLRRGLRALEGLHEAVPILDSDSDDDISARVVLRPAARDRRDTRASSDSDSEESFKEELVEEYSDSEPEEGTDEHTGTPSLSSVTGLADTQTTQPIVPDPELEESPRPRKLYTVERPITAQIFPEEPPPPSNRSCSSSDEDIFAELHKQPYHHSNKAQNAADDLFGSVRDIDEDIGNIVSEPVHSENSPLFTSNLLPETKLTQDDQPSREGSVKKPVGGISLFGTKGSDSIGAAILKRTQRQSSSESDATDAQTKKHNIIDDLFAKPVKNVKKGPAAKREGVIKEADDKKQKIDNKVNVDLFSDNIFDDIDDIFTSNVITKTKHTNTSLFDDGLFDNDQNGDDLFGKGDADKNTSNVEVKNKMKSIFDSGSDDDLFSKTDTKNVTRNETIFNDKPIIINDKKVDEVNETKVEIKVDNLNNQLSPNIFGDDDDDDDLFIDKPLSKECGDIKSDIAKDDLFGDEIQYRNPIQDDVKSETRNYEIKKPETEEMLLEKELPEEKDSNSFVSKDNVMKPDDADVIFSGESNKDSILNDSEIARKDITNNSGNENEVRAGNDEVPSLPEMDFTEETEDMFKDDECKDDQDVKPKDMFVDIFSDLPPAFEKPVESKKSKNVNALFDDDSDDEALFFKKDDVITDEKPEIETSNDRFRIFHDEPPDIDVDFIQKSRNTDQVPGVLNFSKQKTPPEVEDLFDDDIKEEDFKSNIENSTEAKPKVKSDVTKSLDSLTTSGNKEQTSKIDILKLLESEKDEDIFEGNRNEEALFSDTEKEDSSVETKTHIKDTIKEEIDSSESERRRVGKLRPMNLNINVSSLLPGAVPKKPKRNEETDGQTSSKISDQCTEIANLSIEAVSAKENPDPGVLDNKLSKERAKIQVKRRPSTRRARLEAVRKSGLDFGSDSTDNSSSFDEPNKDKPRCDTGVPYKGLNDNKTNETKPTNTKRNVTSKVVYILNDEDIFNVPTRGAGSDVGDDLFKPISTLGDAYKEQGNIDTNVPKKSLFDDETPREGVKEVQKPKRSLFDDASDDDAALFKKPAKKIISDSDSDSELFAGKRDKGKQSQTKEQRVQESKSQRKAKENKVDKKLTKASLFSDDSDDELFGARTRKYDVKDTPKQKPSAKSSQAFEDPLSTLGADDA